MVGLAAPVRPNRVRSSCSSAFRGFSRCRLQTIRQTDEGTVLIGDSQQDRGFDDSCGIDVLAAMAARADACFRRSAMRASSALGGTARDDARRFSVYEQSASHPGAFVASCHSGVTLAAAHAYAFAPAVAAVPPRSFRPFGAIRFGAARSNTAHPRRARKLTDDGLYDVAVIGAGPAGLAAATVRRAHTHRDHLVRRAASNRAGDATARRRRDLRLTRCFAREPTPAARLSSFPPVRRHLVSMQRSGRPAGATTACARSASRMARPTRAALLRPARAMIVASARTIARFRFRGNADGSLGAAEARALLDAKGVGRVARIVLAGNGPRCGGSPRSISMRA